MGTVLSIFGGLIYLAGFVCHILLVIDAFKAKGAGWGVLAFCFPPAAWYHGFVQSEHPKAKMFTIISIAAYVVGWILLTIGGTMASTAMIEDAQRLQTGAY